MSDYWDSKDHVVTRPSNRIYRGLEIVRYKNWESTPFVRVRTLSEGRFGQVNKVRSKRDQNVYACKTFKVREQTAEKLREDLLDEFIKVRRMTLSNNVVRAVSTFIIPDQSQFSLVLEPVASEGDLDQFIKEYRNTDRPVTTSTFQAGNKTYARGSNPEERYLQATPTLLNSFYSLSKALSAIHAQGIRHRDIKPANCLIHKGRVLLSDFRFARLYNGAEKYSMGSYGNPGIKNYRYRAPKVLRGEHRDKATDVFSLGCTFVEILATLQAHTSRVDPWPAEKKESNEQRIQVEVYAKDIKSIVNGISNPFKSRAPHYKLYRPDLSPIYKIVRSMMYLDQEKQPTAEELRHKLVSPRVDETTRGQPAVQDSDSSGLFVYRRR